MIQRVSAVRIFKEARMVHQQAHHAPQQQSEGGGGKSPERKSLQHLVNRDQNRPEAKARHRAPAAVGDEFRAHLADGVAAHGAHGREIKCVCTRATWLYLRGVAGGLGFHRNDQSPLLLKFPAATERLLARSEMSLASFSFINSSPATPLPVSAL